MNVSKIDVTVGPVAFAGEGDPAWLAEQLDKVLQLAPGIVRGPAAAPKSAGEAAQPTGDGGEAESPAAPSSDDPTTASLAHTIRQKRCENSQVDRFLVTADWLRRRGVAKLTTAAVTKAIVDNQQKRLANPADCLNKNVSKGFCEKNDGGFYITPEGLKKLGY